MQPTGGGSGSGGHHAAQADSGRGSETDAGETGSPVDAAVAEFQARLLNS